MRKYLIPILLVLLVAVGASAWALTFQGQGQGRIGAAAIPFFETDWSTNSPGVSDEGCIVCGGCSGMQATWDEWVTIYNDTDLSVVDGKLVHALDASGPGYLQIDDEATEPFNGTTYTEYWAESKWEWDGTALVSTVETPIVIMAIFGDTVDGNLKLRPMIYTSVGGAIDGMTVRFSYDSGYAYVCAEQAWSPAANTQYTFRVHWRKSSGVGANDGIVSWVIVGGPSCEDNAADDDLAGYVNYIRFGNPDDLYDEATIATFKFDNFKFYVTDPGWG